MKRFVVGVDRSQALLLPERLDDYVHEDNPVRVIDAFVEALDLGALGFSSANRDGGGRPAYHPAALLKIYIYGYLNRIQSSRRVETLREPLDGVVRQKVLVSKVVDRWNPSRDSCSILG